MIGLLARVVIGVVVAGAAGYGMYKLLTRDKVKEEINEQFKDDTSDLLKKAFAAKVMEKQKDSITLDVLDEWENPIVRDVNIRGDEVSNDIHVGDLISLVD